MIFLFSPIDLRTLRLHFLKVSQCDGVSSGREKALRLGSGDRHSKDELDKVRKSKVLLFVCQPRCKLVN